MGRATLIELLHLAIGLGLTAGVFYAAGWSYPQAGGTLNTLSWITMAAVLAMSLPELRKAWIADRAKKDGTIG